MKKDLIKKVEKLQNSKMKKAIKKDIEQKKNKTVNK
jgi:hypothetical protein